jgi:hypothetical protein
MSWPCFLVKSIRQGEWEETPSGGGKIRRLFYTLPDGREVKFNELPVGAMWHSSQQPEGTYYHHDEPSICVVLPGRVIWQMNGPGTNGFRWSVSGEMPNVTASPSINFNGIYHGFVQNGVVTDDVEGRRFDAMGFAVGAAK